ncbi:MAG TPA: hypothetical protein VF796_12635 [Humisphaera sp.]
MSSNTPDAAKTNPDRTPAPTPDSGEACATDGRQPGPVREGGGMTGAGNLSQNQASRTGGATGGVDDPTAMPPEPRRGVTPDP